MNLAQKKFEGKKRTDRKRKIKKDKKLNPNKYHKSKYKFELCFSVSYWRLFFILLISITGER